MGLEHQFPIMDTEEGYEGYEFDKDFRFTNSGGGKEPVVAVTGCATEPDQGRCYQ